jgi:hypothetical protein
MGVEVGADFSRTRMNDDKATETRASLKRKEKEEIYWKCS